MVSQLFVVTLIGQVMYLAVALIYPGVAANEDYIDIQANGTFDSLKERWHKMNGWLRVITFGPLAVMVILPAVVMVEPYWALWVNALLWILSAGLVSICLHWQLFDQRLNRLRKLEDHYVGKNATVDIFVVRKGIDDILKVKRFCFLISLTCYALTSYLVLIKL